MSRCLGIDVGGSTIKQAVVETPSGRVLQVRADMPTPQPATPAAILDALMANSPGGCEAVGLAFPTVVKNGRAHTAANVDPQWLGVDGAAELARRLKLPAVFLNDADAAGIAEMRIGAGRGLMGVVIVLTFGTGIGTAPFVDGRLLPNTELGHLPLRGGDAEHWASARARTRDQLDFPAWAARVNDYLDLMQRLFWPDVFIVGGSVSEHFEEFGPLLKSPARILPAQLRGQAGVVGAALAAADAFQLT
jgi:polyphosphate glucokinase